MIIIAFSPNTSKVLPRLLCRRFRHTAPIFQTGKKLIMYQFVRYGHIEKIYLTTRDISILRAHGWQFVYVPIDAPSDFHTHHAHSCVGLSKCALGLRARFIQTPLGLYRYLNRK
ncbi:MAG: hypothetical protein IJ866_01600 [Alphaproteobacteria bacterium]|nr:hypothetical protein [Alphaproteobacteria bacterium]